MSNQIKSTEYEEKFLVIPLKDAVYLSEDDRMFLNKVQDVILEGRKAANKKIDNNYYVCNQDEPYANKVLDIILEGEDLKKSIVKKPPTLDKEP